MKQEVFEALKEGIVDGLSKFFGIGDGLEDDNNPKNIKSDGEYTLRVFYFDEEKNKEHVIKVRVVAEVESVRDA